MRKPLLLTAAAALFAILFSTGAFAQSTPSFVTGMGYESGSTSRSDAAGLSLLRGHITSPVGILPGAIVELTTTKQRCVSNAAGEFSILLPADGTPQEATVSFAGFADEMVILSIEAPDPVIEIKKPQTIKVRREQRLESYLKTARRQSKKELRNV
ncbi:hypothetical protein Q5H93_19195 [Hymenobacter sp. ASUV-10]|uniref:Carboxypeptidase-like regulatory domain-containing protein n=1 Tax=Hymenobacter aranciens TaxID=3063996 RepID=A0ABT9BGG3_9BACT|nr:hypothetical protein [Hymenobacter sp. ASUV-10]MDO7876880.1 hypothetical protein [Hymenobacter sp. ASUV-10]